MRRLMNVIMRLRYRSQYKKLRAKGFSKGAATWLLGSPTAKAIVDGKPVMPETPVYGIPTWIKTGD